MAQHRLGLIMNGVTGRMGMNQHLIRSIVAIRDQGGVTLKNGEDTLFFDAATTQLRAQLLRTAMAAGKHVYCEKPVADNLADAIDLVRAAKKAGIKHGVVQDKLFLP